MFLCLPQTYDTPPPEAIESLPDRLRGIFTDRPLVYSASRHADFAQQLMSRLRLPPRTARGRPSGDWHTEEQGMEGEGARQGGQQGDTVFGIGPGDDEQDDQMGEVSPQDMLLHLRICFAHGHTVTQVSSLERAADKQPPSRLQRAGMHCAGATPRVAA